MIGEAGVKNIMDKCTIIRLLEDGRSKRSVAKELNIHHSTVTKYWKEYLQKKEKIALDPTDSSKKEVLTAEQTEHQENTQMKWIDGLMSFFSLIMKKQRNWDHINRN
ncbi:helix-turn-helix domain-containing protein [Enterococcus faecalis]|uniref:helix-turn-helix domain-containing protein n=1 Tax=Enterococcus faecalis TaxID=1351 RepID=UPI00209010F9|nr:helix-turn-helix domain-containing protein [Enterococcus faecalis]MCO5542261.1 helix-turn-helix domain-containing protein [Enterococcus faecalis]